MNQRKLRFLIFLACLSLISGFAKMPTAYSCPPPPPQCPDCTIGPTCVRDCRTPECCILDYYCRFWGDCLGGCEDCYVEGWCPEIHILDNFPSVTCVGCEVSFETDVPNYGDYFPGCCDCMGWTTDPPEGSGGGYCWFINTWYTTGLKKVTARLPCGSHDEVGVYVLKIEKVEMEVNGSWQDVTGANITVLKGTRYTFKATLSPTPPSWPSDVFSWSGVAIGNGQTIVVTFDDSEGPYGPYTLTAMLGCGTGTNCVKNVTINVVTPTVYQIGFAGDSDLYKTPSAWGGWADGTTLIIDPVYNTDANNKNDPVCVTKNSSTVSLSGVKLKVPQALTYSTTIRVDANGTKNWNESADVVFSGTTSGAATLGIKGNIINQVKKYGGDFQIQWKYRVLPPDGTNAWNNTGTTSHTVYVTYGTPQPGGSELTVQRISTLCEWASDANTPQGVADGIHSSLSLPFGHDPNKQSDDWDLMWASSGKQGECDEHARFMVRALKLIGSTGDDYLTMASQDSSNVEDLENQTVAGIKYFLCFDFDNNGFVDNRFEGSVSSGSHYYAVTPKLNANSKCRLLRQIGPDSYGATQRWAEYQGDDFWNRPPTGRQLPGDVNYPSCP